jgi:hypothetical protein
MSGVWGRHKTRQTFPHKYNPQPGDLVRQLSPPHQTALSVQNNTTTQQQHSLLCQIS